VDRKATGDTVLVKSMRDDGKDPNTAVVAAGRRGKGDRKQNSIGTLLFSVIF
jgi:hypothetical protein